MEHQFSMQPAQAQVIKLTKADKMLSSIKRKLSLMSSENLKRNLPEEKLTQTDQKANLLKSSCQISDLLETFNTDLQDDIMAACVSIYQCKEIKSPELITVEHAYTLQSVVMFLKAHLVRVCEFVGVKEKLSDWQLQSLSVQIYNECPTLTMSEFILFCARLRTGRYGKFYGSVDPQLVFLFFGNFLEEKKQDYLFGKREQEKIEKERKEAESKSCSQEDVQQMLADGKLPFLAKLQRTKYQKQGKQLDFLESIINLMNFKQNNR